LRKHSKTDKKNLWNIIDMRIALCSDEPYPMNFSIAEHLESLGHEILRFGSLKTKNPESWADQTRLAAEAVAQGVCDEGVFFCWTGTGASIVANKIPGIRAALCTDVETTKGARIWNDANVLVMSNRLINTDLAKDLLNAWLNTQYKGDAEEDLKEIKNIEKMHTKPRV
jgi:ribose 5-phosphate isomerase B